MRARSATIAALSLLALALGACKDNASVSGSNAIAQKPAAKAPATTTPSKNPGPVAPTGGRGMASATTVPGPSPRQTPPSSSRGSSSGPNSTVGTGDGGWFIGVGCFELPGDDVCSPCLNALMTAEAYPGCAAPRSEPAANGQCKFIFKQQDSGADLPVACACSCLQTFTDMVSQQGSNGSVPNESPKGDGTSGALGN